MKKKTIMRGLLALTATATLAYAAHYFIPTGQATTAAADASVKLSYTKVQLSSGSLIQTVTSTGSLSYENTQTLKAPQALTVAEIPLLAGDRVKAGDTLLTYDLSGLLDNLEQTKADLTLQDAQIASLADAQSSEATITAQAAGVVKALYLQTGQMTQAQLQGGPAALLSLDGLMQVEINPSQPLTLGQSVRVSLGTVIYTGSVCRLDAGKALVTFPDTRAAIGDSVQVKLGNVIVGTGEAQIHLPFPVYTTLNGVVDNVDAALNDSLRANESLYSLTGVTTSADYQAALEKREELKSQIKALEVLIISPQLLSPIGGIIKEVAVQEGQTAAEGALLLTLYVDGDMVMKIDVDELDILKVALAQEGSVLMDAQPSAPYRVKVSHIASLGISSGGITGYTVTLRLEDNAALMMGMNGTATLTVGESGIAVLAPLSALYSDRSGSYVWLYQEGFASTDETPGIKTYIQTGLSNDRYTAVSQGLREDQSVMVKNNADEPTTQTNRFGMGNMPQAPGGISRPEGGFNP